MTLIRNSLLAACILAVLAGDAREPIGMDPRAAELAIVPMPKRIRLTDRDLVLDPARVTLAIGEQASRPSVLGAEWINQRLAETGGTGPLPIIRGPALPAEGIAIIIGTVDDQPHMAAAVRNGAIDVGADNPGAQGYEIRASPDGRRIYLAGADPIGALYACVTFGELLEPRDGRVAWRSAEVRDWPDLLHRSHVSMNTGGNRVAEIIDFGGYQLRNVWNEPPTPEFRERYLAILRETYDRMLRRKLSSFRYDLDWHLTRHAPPETLALIREGIELGRERGIGALNWFQYPFVALVEDHPDLPSELGGDRRYDHRWIRGWAPRFDEIREETAHALAEWAAHIGFTDIGFHDSDGGWYYNPAQWNERDEESRTRWGDDYAAATAHKHQVYYDALKAANPDLRIHFTLYPYNISAMDPDAPLLRERGGWDQPERLAWIASLWRDWGERLAPDVTLVISRNTRQAVDAFRNVWPHGIFTYLAAYSRPWYSFVHEYPAFLRTYFRDSRDLPFPITHEPYVPLQGTAALEYAWNVEAPGASDYREIPAEEAAEDDRSAEIYRTVYPRVVRNLFGRGAAADMLEAVLCNVAPNQVFGDFGPSEPNLLDTAGRMREQARRAERGVLALDRVQARLEAGGHADMDPRGRFYHAYLREVMHNSLWTARIRSLKMEAMEQARGQDLDAARATLAEAEALVREARPALAAVLAQRPAGMTLPMVRKYMIDGAGTGNRRHTLDLDALQERIARTAGVLPELARPIPDSVVEALARGRAVRAGPADAEPGVNGRLDHPAWKSAWPIESFFTFDPEEGYIREVARAYTRVRLLHSGQHLYVGFENAAAAAAPAEDRDREAVEVLLLPAAGPTEAGYAYIALGADGRVRQERYRPGDMPGRFERVGTDLHIEGLETAVAHHDDGWSAMLKIPLQAIDAAGRAAGWRINLARHARLAAGWEWSATQPPGSRNNHDVTGFRALHFAGASDRHVPSVHVDPHGLELGIEAFIEGGATTATFGVRLQAAQVLNDVVVRAETWNPDGEREGSFELARRARVFYAMEWPAPSLYVRFGRVHERGGIRVVIESREGTFERWLRFGGWEGVEDGPGALYTPGRDGGWSARDAFHFPDRITVEGETHRLFNGAEGTIEFWFTPETPRRTRQAGGPEPLAEGDVMPGEYTFLHYGPIRPDHPRQTNNSPVSIQLGPEGRLRAGVLTGRFAGWRAAAEIRADEPRAWRPGEWRHVALVWEATAPEADRLRWYVNGQRGSRPPWLQRGEYLPDPVHDMVETDRVFPVQVGAMNSGASAMGGRVDELRISRVARYHADFTPGATGPEPDAPTTALFLFDRSLRGRGRTPGGAGYDIEGRAGTP